MTTRTIVTSQPDVACYVCGRRLLRGEQPEMFLVDGHPRPVCELCAPRAAHQGWPRGSEGDRVTLPPLRTRRGRNLFERLRHMGRPMYEQPDSAVTAAKRSYDDHGDSYDFLGGTGPLVSDPVAAAPADRPGLAPSSAPRSTQAHPAGAHPAEAHPAEAHPAEAHPTEAHPPGAGGVAEPALPIGRVDEAVERAIEVFNAGEYPRRVAGVARSLGVPGVSVHAVEDGGNAVVIVVGWELCWYRYVVDFDQEPVEARCIAQGTELKELPREDRLANAGVNDAGAVSPSARG
jgi:hypothetical protein